MLLKTARKVLVLVKTDDTFYIGILIQLKQLLHFNKAIILCNTLILSLLNYVVTVSGYAVRILHTGKSTEYMYQQMWTI